jgi:uncharacterized protein
MEDWVASRYNFELRLDDGRLVLYNSRTGSLIVADQKEADGIAEFLADPRENHVRRDELIHQGIIVSKGADELGEIQNWHETWLSDSHLVHLTMLPAEACNFSCPYCFQFNRRNLLMKPWVYDATYSLLERIVRENEETDREQPTMLKVAWFGGEPTLAADRILVFQHRLRNLQDRHNVKLRATLVTNGYLLSLERFVQLLDSGITEYQITLDGDSENHDKLRHLKSGKPTFDVIYGNLKRIAQLPKEVSFSFSIRGNFLRDTVPAMHRLLGLFARDFGNDQRFQIYFRPVYHFETTRNNVDEVAAEICGLREGLGLQNTLALETMRTLNLDSMIRMFDPLPKPVPGWCPADRRNTFIIGADGSLFLCETLVGDKGKAQGRMTPEGDLLLNESGRQWRTSFFAGNYESCFACKLLPVCLGGCRRARVTAPGGKALCFWAEEDIRSGMRECIRLLA